MADGDAGGGLESRCLCLDIETRRDDRTALQEIGAYRPDQGRRLHLSGQAPDLAARLDALTAGAAYLLGHNIAVFDQPVLRVLHPALALHRLPLVDTLELSPIAFPQNPYHRLVKDYKLCTLARNDPVRDAELAHALFGEQKQALVQRIRDHPDEALCLHFLLTPADGPGLPALLAAWRGQPRPALAQAASAWRRCTDGKVCRRAQAQLLAHWLPDPAWHQPLAYVLAWLRVAGGNSVLPPWVRHNIPRTREAIAALRDTPCDDPACTWCREQHQLERLLPRFFAPFTAFRPLPATPDGRSLQRSIVEHGMAGRSALAILPTGGGKSLCYQLPALAHYYRTAALTVVVSPLQSLMKDQVDNLVARGITCAGYLNGLLGPIERRAMLDRLRLGDLGLVFVAPEQFRSPAFVQALAQREVRAWVFDEAHCLSKWGHDFRPDYLYVSRFIRQFQPAPSPVFCFTATAKPDVVQDILRHFDRQLGLALVPLEGGVERINLAYEVLPVPTAAKFGETLRLLQQAQREDGGAIVFCARQKTVEEVAAFLNQAGLACGHFHGGMQAADKRAVQEDFIAGRLRVIAATNAFGMGVDKPDVRLVVHLDTPGSLENYLQEAGRAGRDQAPARCVLLYDDADLDVQFRLLKNARLSQHEIQTILKALRAIERKDRAQGEVIVTSGELLMELPDQQRIDPDARDADTKVRIAVAWLEEARLLERHENHTRVFPDSLRVASLDEARERLARQLGPQADLQPYLDLLAPLLQADADEGLSTDALVLATGRDARAVQAMLRELDRWRLLSNDTEIGVTLQRAPDTGQRLAELERLEDALVAALREAAPDAGPDDWQLLDVRRLCDLLRRRTQLDLAPERLTRLLKSFAEPFGQGTGQRGFFALRPAGADHRQLRLQRDWRDIDRIRARRLQLARALVQQFLRLRQGNQLLVTCPQGTLEAQLRADATLAGLDIRDWDSALAAALLYLHANEVLHLARGKAVFRSAMRIALNPEARRRQFSKADHAELALHYKDKVVQVHVMAEYARLALRKLQAAMDFIVHYFALGRAEFVQRYFAGRKEVLDIAATEATHRRVLTDLANPAQQAIVAAPLEGSQLVLAGPGSGKTRVIVHRVAWLLRECMVRPEEIMVLAYNRSAASEIRRRLWALAGADAGGVTVQTLHGFAMRLTGTSYAVASEHGEEVDFSAVIRQATASLQQADAGEGAGASAARDRLLSGLRFLLVDEYQDINGEHYALISAIAGRTLHGEEDRLSLMAVGDDDQNIYAFGGASAAYIRQFEADYQARRHSLLENYRSTAHIVQCANRVIAPARGRMKDGQPLRVDHARRAEPDGGAWAARDPLAGGRVQVLEVPPQPLQEAALALDELQRLHALAADAGSAGCWGRFAAIARRKADLDALAALCRARGMPVQLLHDSRSVRLHQTREGAALRALLQGAARRTPRRRMQVRPGALSRWFRRRHGQPVDGWIAHPWRAALARFIRDAEGAAGGYPLLAGDVVEALHEHAGAVQGDAPANAPMTLMTAHRAKGMEFDHVLILDAGGWLDGSDDERRLYYVAMTRARLTLTLCERAGSRHPFVRATDGLALRARPMPAPTLPAGWTRVAGAGPADVVLSWPARAAPAVHAAIAALDVGAPLALRRRGDGQEGWELADAAGRTVGRMARRFAPPPGRLVQVRVAALLARRARPQETARVPAWEVVLPEFEWAEAGG
ncbi:RecQ family ATP-dependent DNA helicase [Pseudorhodoferax sp.]|uniref:RecQ family ATP-dependent DNA helicase n=1 Tax=Pseudorhodoferax sp. TaxID=1993553 RepID=UPI0039E285F2